MIVIFYLWNAVVVIYWGIEGWRQLQSNGAKNSYHREKELTFLWVTNLYQLLHYQISSSQPQCKVAAIILILHLRNLRLREIEWPMRGKAEYLLPRFLQWLLLGWSSNFLTWMTKPLFSEPSSLKLHLFSFLT